VDLPLDPRPAIPASEPGRLRDVARRTLFLRVGLAVALLVALALAFLVASSQEVRRAPLVPAGTTGMLVLDLSASVYPRTLNQTVEKLSETDERTGLVVFSDSAYELLPPGSPSRELASLLRLFRSNARNPWEVFSAGTRISTGLDTARRALLREGVTKGSVLLVSDLQILADEVSRVSTSIAQLRAEGYQIRIVPLFPSEEKRALIEQLTGSKAFLGEPETEDVVKTPEERGLGLAAAAPWLFLLAAALVVVLLAANERLLSRLEVRR
jgi:hypothetical protein